MVWIEFLSSDATRDYRINVILLYTPISTEHSCHYHNVAYVDLMLIVKP